VEHCIYGVDLDPLAVELARLALWIETMDRTLPFEFLDHKLKVGNALIGCWFDRFRDYPVLAWDREAGDKGHSPALHYEADRGTRAIRSFKNKTIKPSLARWIQQTAGQRSFLEQFRLRRLRAARELGVGDLDLSRLPPGRLKQLARSANTARAQSIQRMPVERSMATLVAFACILQASAQDDVLDVVDRVFTDLLARVDRQEQRRRLRTIGDLDMAALLLRDIGLAVLDEAKSDRTLRHDILARWPRERIEQAVATVGALARPPENNQAPEALLNRYSMVRQFLPLLLQTLSPHATQGGRAALAAWEFLLRIERLPTPDMRQAPLHIVTPAWWRLVIRPDKTPRPPRVHLLCVTGDTRRIQTA
jgi:hypothetical protein